MRPLERYTPAHHELEIEGEQGVEFGFGGAVEIFKVGVNGEAELVKAVVIAVGQRALLTSFQSLLMRLRLGL